MRKLLLVLMAMLMAAFALAVTGCGDTKKGALEEGYYQYIIMRPDGEFIGINKLKDSKHRLAFKVSFEDGKLAEIKRVYNDSPLDSAGWILDTYGAPDNVLSNMYFSKIKVTYEGNTKTYSFLNVADKPVPGFYYEGQIKFFTNDKGTVEKAVLYKLEETASAPKYVEDRMYKFAYDENQPQLLKSYNIYNKDGKDFSDLQGGIAYTYDKDAKAYALPLTLQFLDKDGKAADNINKVSKISFTYNEKLLLTELKNENKDGKPAALEDSQADRYLAYNFNPSGNATKYTYDKDNYLIKKEFLNAEGKPDAAAFSGGAVAISFTRNQLEDGGYTLKISCTGADGKPAPLCLDKYSENVTSVLNTYNGKGLLTESRFFDANDGLTATNHNFAIIQYEYNDKNLLSGVAYFGVEKEPVTVDMVTKSGKNILAHREVYVENEEVFYDVNNNKISD